MVLVLVVVFAAFALSFTVLSDLSALSGIPHDVAWLWPVIVDGTIAAATLVFYTSRGKGRRMAFFALVMFGLASIVGNVAHILLVDPTRTVPAAIAVFVGVMPPVGLIMTVELLGSLLRARANEVHETTKETVSAVDREPDTVRDPDPMVHQSSIAEPVVEPVEPEPFTTDPQVTPGSRPWSTDEPAVEPEPVSAEPVASQGSHSWSRVESALDVLPEPMVPTSHEARAQAVEPGLSEAVSTHSDELTPEPALTPVVSIVRDDSVVDPRPEPMVPVQLTAEPVAEPEPIPETTEGQVAWIADQARAGEPITASVLVTRFAEVGHELSLSTVKRRIAAARTEHPDAFEMAS